MTSDPPLSTVHPEGAGRVLIIDDNADLVETLRAVLASGIPGLVIDTATAAMCKWWLTHVQCEVIDRCLQLFGGYGYILEYPIARLYCDARAQKIYGGSNEIQKELIARSL